MKNFFKRISVIIFSAYLCIAHPVAALADINDIIRNQYIAASVAVASLFSAFGFIPKAGNAALSEMVQDCVADAQQAGYTVMRNGVPSVGIAISEGYTYLSKAFCSWVYSWSADNLTGVTGDTVVQFPTPNENLTYQFQPFTGSWTDLLGELSLSYPAQMISIIESTYQDYYGESFSNNNYFCYEYKSTTPYGANNVIDSDGYHWFYVGGLYCEPQTFSVKKYYDSTHNYYAANLNGNYNAVRGLSFRWKYNNDGELLYRCVANATGIFKCIGKGWSIKSHDYANVWSTLNTTVQTTAVGWDTTGDNPTKVHDIDEYAQTWAGDRTKQVDIDGTNQEGVPTTIPIDDVAVNVHVTVPAADIVNGLADAINAALQMGQSVAREGAISTPASEELEKENVATDNAISLEDAQPIATDFVEWGINYVQPHLSEIFQKYPFSIPYDMYLILNSVYSGSTVRTRSLNSVSLRSGSGDPTNMNPSNVGIILDFNYVERDPASYNDPNAPKFDYDFNVTAFEKNYHFVGSFDFAPYGWLFQLMKVGIGIIWIAGLLNYNIQSIRGKNK